MRYLYQNIKRFSTPCGDITITDNNTPLNFSVCRSPLDRESWAFYGSDNAYKFKVNDDYELHISTGNLTTNRVYKISLCGNIKMNYGDSDEYTEAVAGTENGFSISIGAYDPNANEKLSQHYKAHQSNAEFTGYDKSLFTEYEITRLSDCSGYSFALLDNFTIKEIVFKSAWIKHYTPAFLRHIPDLESEFERMVIHLAMF